MPTPLAASIPRGQRRSAPTAVKPLCHAIIESKLDPEVDVLPVDGALKVTVRLFAGYRQAAGTASVPLELAEGATVGGLAEQVVRLYPAIGTDPSKLVVAVNQEYADHDLSLKDGDEVALIPPVSGGLLAVFGQAAYGSELWHRPSEGPR